MPNYAHSKYPRNWFLAAMRIALRNAETDTETEPYADALGILAEWEANPYLPSVPPRAGRLDTIEHAPVAPHYFIRRRL